jgi:endonuclease/exonuclease/phosphatase family metal-dependent hydrolase
VPLLIGGDFNCRPEGQAHTPKLKAAAERFTDWMQLNAMACQLRLTKRSSQTLTRRKATLDYFVVPSRFQSGLQDAKVVVPPVFSDHRMLLVRFHVKDLLRIKAEVRAKICS